jgi:thiosulfate/3-mercaptopyruvate sulfurtransferase
MMTVLLMTILPALAPAPAVAASGGAAPAAVVSTAWLADNLKSPGLVILDARPSLRDYLGGHLPGAQPLLVENVRSTSGGVVGEMLPAEVVAVLAGRLGIDTRSHVVVYGAENDPDPTYVATALRQAGLERVSVLDGGLKIWQQEQRPVVADRPPVSPARPRLEGTAPDIARLDEVRRAVETRGAVLLDVRSTDQYDAGHLPGAVNRFWKSDLVPEGSPRAGLLRGEEELAREYASLGIGKERPVIVYCNTGHMASQVFHTLRYRLGYPLVKLYDGSWVEWSAVEGLPREQKIPTGK